MRFANAPQDSKVTGFASARSALAATVAPKSNIAYLSNSKSPFSTAIQPTAPVISIRNPGCQTRALTGYLIWRLLPGQEANPVSWTPLGTGVVTGLTFTDENWQNLPNGNYRWAVKAVYTSNVLSVPSFSNVLQKETITGFISGVVRNTQSQALAGAAITAATYSATTNSVGAYSMLLPIGVYNVTAAKTGYQTQTTEDITVTANQTSTVNFYLEAGSGLEDELAPITATALNGNYPNPFNPETTISFALNEPERVCITIYNLKGQIVQTLHNATLARGYHSLVWNGKDKFGNAVGSGVYYYRMQAGSYQSTRKMLLME